jgi:hypothetical protein
VIEDETRIKGKRKTHPGGASGFHIQFDFISGERKATVSNALIQSRGPYLSK